MLFSQNANLTRGALIPTFWDVGFILLFLTGEALPDSHHAVMSKTGNHLWSPLRVIHRIYVFSLKNTNLTLNFVNSPRHLNFHPTAPINV